MNKRPRVELVVKFSDCDPFGHLHNVRYLDCMFDGREQHVIDNYFLLRKEMRSRQQNWVIAATDIRYLRPAACGDRLAVDSSIFQVSHVGVTLEIALIDPCSDSLKAILWSQLRYVDLVRGVVVRHPPHMQAFLEGVALDMPYAALTDRIRHWGTASPQGATAARAESMDVAG